MRLERGTDPDMSATLTSLLEIDCEKLRPFHEKQGTLRLQIAVEKGRKSVLNVDQQILGTRVPSEMCTHLYWLSSNMSRPTVSNDDGNTPKTRTYDPPEDTHKTMFTPPTSQEAVESESEDMLITPKTHCYEPSFDESIPLRHRTLVLLMFCCHFQIPRHFCMFATKPHDGMVMPRNSVIK